MLPSKVRIAFIAGTRPNFMKVAPLLRELPNWPQFTGDLIHTGQHSSPEMSDSFFEDLEIPEPDVNLGVSGGTHSQQTAEVMLRLEPVLEQRQPDLVLVVGDVNSSLAATLVAAKMHIPVAHVEAGLRSFDRRMPEEINRIVTDAVSDYLFTSEPSGQENLLAEGCPASRIFFVGNVMIDTLLRYREKASRSQVLERIGVRPRHYAAVTLHRPSNVDEPAQLRALLGVLEKLSERLPVVFPVHPRTRNRLPAVLPGAPALILTDPMRYLDFIRLIGGARLVLTDSGGVQEETTILGVPCLTLRENTERPVTIEQGTNRLAGTDPEQILDAAFSALEGGRPQVRPPELWDGMASRRIFHVLANIFSGSDRARPRGQLTHSDRSGITEPSE